MFLCNLQNLSFPTTDNFFRMNILFELSQAYRAYPIQKRHLGKILDFQKEIWYIAGSHTANCSEIFEFQQNSH